MLGKFLVKRLLPAGFLYYGGIQAYVVYNTFKGQPRQTFPNPAANPLPASVQARRKELVEGVMTIYNWKEVHQHWDKFHENAMFEDPWASHFGLTALKRIVQFSENKVKEVNTTVKSETQYESSISLDVEAELVTHRFKHNQRIVIWLELIKDGDTEKIVRLAEEWNGVPLITRENTLFPIGWSAETFRFLHGKLFGLLT